MRILHILSQIEMTGAEAYALTLSDWLLGNGNEVSVISNKLHVPTKVQFFPRDIHNSSFFNRVKNIFFVRRFIRENKIQVVHCHSRAAVRVAFWATRGLPVTLISTVHGRQHASFSKRLFDLYGDRIIGVCENVLGGLQKDFKMDPRKMVCIGNPVRTEGQKFVEALPSHRRLAIIARGTGPKGQRTKDLIKYSFAPLLEQFPDLTIDIIGGLSGNLDDITEQRLRELGGLFPGRIHMHGHLNLEDRFKDYSLIIGAGRIPVEALIRGIPCYAIGEASCPGFIRPENYRRGKESNFGDIGLDSSEENFNYSRITEELQKILQAGSPNLLERKILRDQIRADFDSESTSREIFDVYRSSYFRKLHPKPIPVLMYHKIPDAEVLGKHRIFLTKENFERHLRFFKSKKFTTLTFQDLEDFRSLRRPPSEFPEKPIILTFDDGYVDNLRNAGPLLKKYDMKAVIYLLASDQAVTNHWDKESGDPVAPLMNWEEKRQLLDYNFEIGSHGFNHDRITDMSLSEAFRELWNSKQLLEEKLQTKVSSFAFTYGNTAPWAARLAQKAGYTFAVNTDTGGLHLEENPFAIFRTPIFPEDKEAQLRKKTASWYRRYFYLKRGK